MVLREILLCLLSSLITIGVYTSLNIDTKTPIAAANNLKVPSHTAVYSKAKVEVKSTQTEPFVNEYFENENASSCDMEIEPKIVISDEDFENPYFCDKGEFYGFRQTMDQVQELKNEKIPVICPVLEEDIVEFLRDSGLQSEHAPHRDDTICWNYTNTDQYCVVKQKHCPVIGSQLSKFTRTELKEILDKGAMLEYTDLVIHYEEKEKEALLKQYREDQRREYCQERGQ